MEAAERAYREAVTQAYNALGFAGFGRAVPGPNQLRLEQVRLEDIFVRLRLTVEQDEPHHHGKPGEDRATSEQEKPITLAEALGKPLLLVGEPGAGKSTLLRWLAVTFAQGRQRDPDRIGPTADANRLPILIELGHLPDVYLTDDSRLFPDWQTLLPEEITRQARFRSTPPELFQQALKAGRCLLLFDGLDEIANRQARARLAQSLAQVPSLSPGNRVVVGSRPAGLTGGSDGALRHLQRCQIQRFTPDDLQRFLSFWYKLDPTLPPEAQQREADALYKEIKAAPGTLRLAGTPLLATLLLLIWRQEGALPERRVDLYERCCRALVEEWERGHDVAYRGIFATLGWEQHLRLLAPIAYEIHRQEQRTSISREALRKLLEEGLQTERLCHADTAGLEATRFLEALALRSGLLQYLGDEQYGFPHLTVQEYLTARHLAVQPDPEPINAVMEQMHDAWWQEVHLLTIGRLGSDQEGAVQAAALLRAILRRYRPPSRLLRLLPDRRLIDLGWWFPGVQLERRLAWLLRREEIFALWGAAECATDGLPSALLDDLAARAAALTKAMLADKERRTLLDTWLGAPGRRLPPQVSSSIAQALVSSLHDPDWDVSVTAALSLGQVGSGQPAVTSALLATLRDKGNRASEAAAVSLAQLGSGEPAVISALLAIVYGSRDAKVRQAAARGLGQLSSGQPEVISPLLARLHDERSPLAAEQLGQVGNGQPAIISALLAVLHDRGWGVRQAAAVSLAQLGSGQLEAISALLADLHNSESYVRMQAAASLGQVGSGEPAVISALLAALRDSDLLVRMRALASLGQVGSGQPAVISALLAALRDKDLSVRGVAARGLGQVGSGQPAVISALLAALRDGSEHEEVRGNAAASLAQLGSGEPAVISALLAALRDEKVRWTTALNLGKEKITAVAQLRLALVALNRCLYATKDYERSSVLNAIRRLVAGRALPGSPWKPVRSQAERARQRRLAGMLVAAVLCLLALILGGAWLSGVPPFDSFFTAVGSAIGLLAGLAGLAGVTLRDLIIRWNRSNQKGS